MVFERFEAPGLAHYLVGSNGQAAVIDPERSTERYVRAAEAKGVNIAHVVESQSMPSTRAMGTNSPPET
jgi:hydroxyacylglutathione hydrolase